MEIYTCTASPVGRAPSEGRHGIRVTKAVLSICSLGEVSYFAARHELFDYDPCAFTSDSEPKVMAETTADGSATLIFIPAERVETVKGLRMRELCGDSALPN